jgi:transcriptional antiterminator NusG
VLRVQTNREESVRDGLLTRVRAAALEEQISAVLVPTESVSEIKAGKKVTSEHKIYPGYLFVEMELSEQTLAVVKNCPGIGDFLGTGGEAVALSEKEVEKVTAEAESKEEAPTIKIDFAAGESIKITEGAFKNFDGIVEEVLHEKGLLRVAVSIFGRPTPVELEYWQVEKT